MKVVKGGITQIPEFAFIVIMFCFKMIIEKKMKIESVKRDRSLDN